MQITLPGQETVSEKQLTCTIQCFIGKTEAILSVLIEPDPHGNETGRDAHFHAAVTCPNTMVVADILSEPDRCRITDETCLFVAPIGSPERYPEQRKFLLANELIQSMAFIEFYGSQLVNKIMDSKGVVNKQGNLRIWELNKILVFWGNR